MDCGDRPLSAVGDQNRKTISRSDRKHQSAMIGHHRVALSGDTRVLGFQDIIRMDLPDGGDGGWIRPAFGPLRSKAVLNPGEFFEQGRQVDVPAVGMQ